MHFLSSQVLGRVRYFSPHKKIPVYWIAYKLHWMRNFRPKSGLTKLVVCKTENETLYPSWFNASWVSWNLEIEGLWQQNLSPLFVAKFLFLICNKWNKLRHFHLYITGTNPDLGVIVKLQIINGTSWLNLGGDVHSFGLVVGTPPASSSDLTLEAAMEKLSKVFNQLWVGKTVHIN